MSWKNDGGELAVLPPKSKMAHLEQHLISSEDAIAATLHDSKPLIINKEDLNPTPPQHRTFTSLDIASLWVALVISVSTYYLAGSLVELGMSWWQGLLTVALANLIQLLLAILLGHPGAKYGIPFPVLCRASLGIRGAHIAACLRGLIACGWYGIDTWIGGQALYVFINSLCNGKLDDSQVISWLGISLTELGCFLIFWLLQIVFILHGVNGIRYLEKYSVPALIALSAALLIWAYVKAGGFQEMLSASSQFGEGGTKQGQFWVVFLSGLTANIGTFATTSLSMSDFTRYARSQTDQVLGHVALPFSMAAFSFVGLAVSSSTEKIFGYIISNPVELLAQIGGIVPTLISLFGVTLIILTTNVANIMAPSNALINLNPTYISFRMGALLTAVLGILVQPWRLFQNGDTFLNKWLLGYSFLVGPLISIVIIDYYILRHCDLDIHALYYLDNVQHYWYFKGYNIKAVIALLTGVAPNIPGFLYTIGALKQVPSGFLVLYEVSWFSSFIMAGFSFWILSTMFKVNHNIKRANG